MLSAQSPALLSIPADRVLDALVFSRALPDMPHISSG
jgi:hypothetical protein